MENYKLIKVITPKKRFVYRSLITELKFEVLKIKNRSSDLQSESFAVKPLQIIEEKGRLWIFFPLNKKHSLHESIKANGQLEEVYVVHLIRELVKILIRLDELGKSKIDFDLHNFLIKDEGRLCMKNLFELKKSSASRNEKDYSNFIGFITTICKGDLQKKPKSQRLQLILKQVQAEQDKVYRNRLLKLYQTDLLKSTQKRAILKDLIDISSQESCKKPSSEENSFVHRKVSVLEEGDLQNRMKEVFQRHQEELRLKCKTSD